MKNKKVYLLLGANLGSREETLKKAIEIISETIAPIVTQSRLYQTAPWGITDQPAFLNQVIEIKTQLQPKTILKRILGIEKQLGRERRLRWGARVIDIDILYYSDLVLNTTDLSLPHPRIHQRRFTLIPLVEISPTFVHPVLNKTNQELLEDCTDISEVNVY